VLPLAVSKAASAAIVDAVLSVAACVACTVAAYRGSVGAITGATCEAVYSARGTYIAELYVA
jgi:hypothetical protein